MFSWILYYGIIIPVSRLPFPVLYLISDFIYFVVYKIIGYRRKVVFNNLSKSFPEKSEKEIRGIERKFYRHLSDLIVESLKTFTISARESTKRMKIRNPEVATKFYTEGKSIVAVGGHNGNWELYAVACSMLIEHDALAYYTPLNNKFFDRKMRESRSRYGLTMVPTSSKEELPVDAKNPTIYLFGIDQCPRKTQRAYWTDFLNQETGVQFGAEKFAREHSMPVLFGNIHKVKRGYYEVEYQLVCEDPSTMEVGKILEESTRMLEKIIKREPEYWLWSHKRWKNAKQDCVG